MEDDIEFTLGCYVGINAEERSIGSVDELGFYALIYVGDVEEQIDITGVPDISIDSGWYVYHENDQGIKNYWQASEQEAYDMMMAVEAEYAQWWDTVDA